MYCWAPLDFAPPQCPPSLHPSLDESSLYPGPLGPCESSGGCRRAAWGCRWRSSSSDPAPTRPRAAVPSSAPDRPRSHSPPPAAPPDDQGELPSCGRIGCFPNVILFLRIWENCFSLSSYQSVGKLRVRRDGQGCDDVATPRLHQHHFPAAAAQPQITASRATSAKRRSSSGRRRKETKKMSKDRPVYIQGAGGHASFRNLRSRFSHTVTLMILGKF